MRKGRPKVALILTTKSGNDWNRWRIDRDRRRTWRVGRGSFWRAPTGPTARWWRDLHVTPGTVCKWRGRFVANRLDGLYDEPRPGAKRTITDEQVEDVIIRTLETTPRGATHWSTREMAKAVGLVTRPSVASGTRLDCSRIGARRSSCPTIRCSLRRSAISSASIWIPRHMRRCSASMRSRRSRPSTARSRCCRCNPAKWSAGRMTTTAMARRPCSPRSTPDQRGDHAISSTASLGAVSRISRSDRRARPPPTRRAYHHGQLQHAQNGADPKLVRQTPALSCALHARPTARGSVSSNAGSPS